MRAFPLLLATLLAPTVAIAKDIPEAEIVRCASVVDDAARLGCYDALAGTISAEARQAAEARKAAAAERAAREAAEQAKRAEDAFGGEQAGIPRQDGRVEELTGKVTESYQDKYGKYLIMLDNGQFWKQLDGKLLTVREGDVVSVERASLGSYRLTVERQKRSVRARRVK